MFVGMILLCVNTECKLLKKDFESLGSCETEVSLVVTGLAEKIKGLTKLRYKCEAKGTNA